MKKIIVSLAIIAVVGAIVVGATTAYFSDTETSKGNTFSAGTIDIRVEGDNFTWTQPAVLEDMKPCYTDYFNFTIYNDGSDPNPVNVWKKLTGLHEETGVVSEPECTSQGGEWINNQCNWRGNNDDDNISRIINYDLYVEVYNSNHEKIWWQTILTDADGMTVRDIVDNFPEGLYLGMIPAGGYMKVIQSYHMRDDGQPTNWAQGDKMSFNIEINAVQLRGEAWLENKTGAPDYKIIHNDGIKGTLTYKVKNPTFDFTFSGTAPKKDANYTLLRAVDPWPQTGSIVLGTGHSDASTGDITITGSLDTGDMKDAKVWLILSDDWNGTQMTAWHQADYLLETGLIWYEDTDN